MNPSATQIPIMDKLLLSFPSEILTQIIINIEGNKWMANLALCCRKLCLLTRPILYTDIEIKSCGKKKRVSRLKLFGEVVSKNHNLATRVRSFTLDTPWKGFEKWSPYKNEQYRGWAPPDLVRQYYLASQGHGEILLAWLISILPNLEILEFQQPPFVRGCLERELVDIVSEARSGMTKAPLSRLREFVMGGRTEYYTTPPSKMFVLLQLPLLQKFRGRTIQSEDRLVDHNLLKISASSIALTHLELRSSNLHMADLTNILRICRTLKTFAYGVQIDPVPRWDFDMATLLDGLAKFEQTLENLELLIEFGQDWMNYTTSLNEDNDIRDDSFNYIIETLSNFKNLRRVKVGATFLFGTPFKWWESPARPLGTVADIRVNQRAQNIMPPSLEQLHILIPNALSEPAQLHLKSILLEKGKFTPYLRQLEIDDRFQRFDKQDLDSLAKIAGVELVMTEMPEWAWMEEIS